MGKEGGVRCSLFHGSWGPLKCCCALGASLWPNIELGVSAGFPSPPKAAVLNEARPANEGGLLKGSKWGAGVRKLLG